MFVMRVFFVVALRLSVCFLPSVVLCCPCLSMLACVSVFVLVLCYCPFVCAVALARVTCFGMV